MLDRRKVHHTGRFENSEAHFSYSLSRILRTEEILFQTGRTSVENKLPLNH